MLHNDKALPSSSQELVFLLLLLRLFVWFLEEQIFVESDTVT